jgi:trigger factor
VVEHHVANVRVVSSSLIARYNIPNKKRFSLATDTQSTFQNGNIQVLLKREPGCKTILDVTVTPEAAHASYSKAVANIKKEISVPGFRKGKAPDSMILEKYQKYINKEWEDILLNTTLNEAIDLIQLPPFNRNSFKSAAVKSVSKEEGARLTYEYEAAPVIPVIAPETLSIPEIKLKTVTQKDINETLENLSLQSGEWNDVTDRPVQEGDYVVIDIDNIGENAGNICTQTLFAVKEGKMGEWMRKLVIGLTPGQTAEGTSEKEEDEEECQACEEGVAGHTHDFIPTLCRITLYTIREAKPHPLDDELAKKYKADSFQKLIEGVKANLEKNAEEEKKDRERKLMELQIFTHYPFDMPASLVQGEVKAIKKSIIDNLRAEGMNESMVQAEAKRIEMEAALKYERDFRLYFLTQKYAQAHNIQVSQDEVTMELMRQLLLKRMGQSTIDTSMDQKELHTQIQLQLLAMKSIDDMIEKAAKTPKKA